MVWTWRFHCQGPGLIPGQGTKILQAGSKVKNMAKIIKIQPKIKKINKIK